MLKSLLFSGLVAITAAFCAGRPPAPVQDPVQEPAAEHPAAPAVKLDGVKCLIMGEAANADAEHSAPWRDGRVYFCCNDCVTEFQKDSAPWSTMANHQLVLTGQYEQKLCPVSGHEVASGCTLAIAGVEIGFCCDNCKAKVAAAATTEEQAAMVFANDVFEKCFAKKEAVISLEGLKCFLMPKKDVNPEKVVEYHGGKVFFCCDGCVKRFSKDPEKFAAQANRQLVQTGQFHQVNCPISGHPVNADQTAEIGGVKVGFCCANCKGKAEGAGEEEQMGMIFGPEAFARGFAHR